MSSELSAPSGLEGLSSRDAERRLLHYGPNELATSKLKHAISDIGEILLNPMGLMLLGLAALHLAIDRKRDASILLLAYIPVTSVDFLLQFKARAALRALAATLQRKARVVRDGKLREVPTRALVPGDLLLLEEGQIMAADGRIIEAHHLAFNEAPLTGESLPVEKSSGALFFEGTTLIQGHGLGCVEATGMDTRFGHIATLLEESESETTPLQRQVQRLIRRVLVVALFLATLLLGIERARGATWPQALIIALTFGMAAIPEEYPIVFTLYLSMGAWRLSHHGVLFKSLPSVEALGSVDVICTDKTGTLTEGRFQLQEIQTLERIEENFLWQTAIMSCSRQGNDAMEAAILEKGEQYHSLMDGWRLKWENPFDARSKLMSQAWEHQDGSPRLAAKGAIEGILGICKLTRDQREKAQNLANDLAGKGNRLLGLAVKTDALNGVREEDEAGLKLLGLMVFTDPIRSSSKSAVIECQKAGIQLKMLTGDHLLTAHSIADRIGLVHEHTEIYTGEQLAKMPTWERKAAYQKGAIFSRVLPEQKHELVQTLQAAGLVVAMTGDGINDVPALKLADIGISMGAGATDAARSSAKIILLQNDITGLVKAVFEGRRILGNLRRSFSYLISFHVPVLLLALVPPILESETLLLPLHIVLLQLIVHPISAFAFENLQPTDFDRRRPLLTPGAWLESATAGFILSLASLALFERVHSSMPLSQARTMTLEAVLFGVTAFIYVDCWPSREIRVPLICGALAIFNVGLCRIPALAEMFELHSLSDSELSLAILAGTGAAIPNFILKRSHSRANTSSDTPAGRFSE